MKIKNPTTLNSSWTCPRTIINNKFNTSNKSLLNISNNLSNPSCQRVSLLNFKEYLHNYRVLEISKPRGKTVKLIHLIIGQNSYLIWYPKASMKAGSPKWDSTQRELRHPPSLEATFTKSSARKCNNIIIESSSGKTSWVGLRAETGFRSILNWT